MDRTEEAIFTNMCMIYDGKGRVLVQDRVNKSWNGLTFPGGHVEPGESFTASVIREIKEETGLEIEHPVLCGVKQFQTDGGARYVVFLYRADTFHGTLRSSEEGEVFWIEKEELMKKKMAESFAEMLYVFEEEKCKEVYLKREGEKWTQTII